MYHFKERVPTFHRAPRPTPAEFTTLLHTISHGVARLLERQELLVRDVDEGAGFEADISWLTMENLVLTLGCSYNDTNLQDNDLRVAPCESGV